MNSSIRPSVQKNKKLLLTNQQFPKKKMLYSVHKWHWRALTPAATSPVLEHISTRWKQRGRLLLLLLLSKSRSRALVKGRADSTLFRWVNDVYTVGVSSNLREPGRGPAECCLRAQGGPRTAAAPLTRISSTPLPDHSTSRMFHCCLRKHKDYFQAANPRKSWVR